MAFQHCLSSWYAGHNSRRRGAGSQPEYGEVMGARRRYVWPQCANMHTASVHNTFVSAASVPYMPQSAWAASGSFKRRRPLVRRACAVPPARAVHVCSARCTPHNERGACAAQPCTPRQKQRFWLNIVLPSAAGPLASTAPGVLAVACPCSDDARLLQCTYS